MEDAMAGTKTSTTAADPSKVQPLIGKAVSRDVAAAFGDTVAVLMRSPFHRSTFLPELEWLVGPGIASGQFAIAHRSDPRNGAQTAVAVVLWALVSDLVHQRLMAASGKPKLKPEEWTSGAVPWLIEAAGEAEATRNLLKSLVAKKFADTGLNMMQLGADGKFRPSRLENKPETTPAAAITN
jgi:hemolysin-activating ACP:hemolysin acyltransferase